MGCTLQSQQPARRTQHSPLIYCSCHTADKRELRIWHFPAENQGIPAVLYAHFPRGADAAVCPRSAQGREAAGGTPADTTAQRVSPTRAAPTRSARRWRRGGAGPVSMAPGRRAGAARCFRPPPDVAARAAQPTGASLSERGAGLLAAAVPLPSSPSSSPPRRRPQPCPFPPARRGWQVSSGPRRPLPSASAGRGPSAIFPPAATPAAGSGSPRAAGGLGAGLGPGPLPACCCRRGPVRWPARPSLKEGATLLLFV